jgi:hypothetical protein
MIDINAVEDEILAGLPNEEANGRIKCALKNLDYYQGNFEKYPYRPDDGTPYQDPRYRRTSAIMQRIVKVLTGNLYQQGPNRSIPTDTAAEDWLNGVYKANAIDARLQQADRLACIGDVCAIQVVDNIGPDSFYRPVKHVLWGAESFYVWLDPEDQTRPEAVATKDEYDNQRRLTLWTSLERRTYLTDKLKPGQTADGRAYKLVQRIPNPFGLIPFSFVHFEFPTTDFWSGGPGDELRNVNDYINFRLTETGDNLRYVGRPLGIAQGVSPEWRPPSPIRPGDFMSLPAGGLNAAGQGPGPDLKYLQADMGFIESEWSDLNAYIDHTLEMHGVPPATIRMVQDSARSGVSIIAEQAPLILWAKSRQRPFAYYESDLARITLAVGGMHLTANGLPAPGSTTEEDPGLVLRWPDMFPDMPGPERDLSDQWLLDNKLTSRTMILMRREGLTREEAEEKLEEIAEDLAKEQQLFPPPMIDPNTGQELPPGVEPPDPDQDLAKEKEEAASNGYAP